MKKKLQHLEPAEIDHLKSTVNELLAIQKVEVDERLREQQHALREQELYRQLKSMYENYGLPTTGMPFGPMMGSPSMTFPMPPRFNAFDSIGDVQFLNQIDQNLGPSSDEASAAPSSTAEQVNDAPVLIRRHPASSSSASSSSEQQPLVLPNPSKPDAKIGDGVPDDVNVRPPAPAKAQAAGEVQDSPNEIGLLIVLYGCFKL